MVFLRDLAPREAQLGVGLIVKHSGRLLFAVPKKDRWETDSRGRRIIRLTGVGGALAVDEDFPAAARRECIEEIGSRPQLESSARTLIVDYDDTLRPVRIDDAIKPAIVFRRVYLRGTESWQLFVAVYLARLHDKPVPLDIPAFVSVTIDGLRLLRAPQRVHRFLNGGGAHMLEGAGEAVPRSAFFSTFGSPGILLLIDSSRRYSLANVLRNRS